MEVFEQALVAGVEEGVETEGRGAVYVFLDVVDVDALVGGKAEFGCHVEVDFGVGLHGFDLVRDADRIEREEDGGGLDGVLEVPFVGVGEKTELV